MVGRGGAKQAAARRAMAVGVWRLANEQGYVKENKGSERTDSGLREIACAATWFRKQATKGIPFIRRAKLGILLSSKEVQFYLLIIRQMRLNIPPRQMGR